MHICQIILTPINTLFKMTEKNKKSEQFDESYFARNYEIYRDIVNIYDDNLYDDKDESMELFEYVKAI